MSSGLRMAARIVRGITEPTLLLSTELRFVEGNAAFAELSGVRLKHLSRGDVSPLTLLRWDQNDQDRIAHEAIQRRQVLRFGEVRVTSQTGLVATVHQTFCPVEDEDGTIVGLLVSYRNVTEESALQEHLRQLLDREKQRAEALEAAVGERTKDLLSALEQVTRLSRTDALTGMLNRRSFTEEADRLLRIATRSGRELGMLLLDIDHFKQVNDRYGHLAGDLILRKTAEALASCVRSTDLVARFGGEEFVVLLVDPEGEAVAKCAERCRNAVREIPLPALVEGAIGLVTISVGVATFPSQAKTLDDLIHRADQALYSAKANGRDCVQHFTPELAREPSRFPPNRAHKVLMLNLRDDMSQHLWTSSQAFSCEIAKSVSEFRSRARLGTFDVLVAEHRLDGAMGEEVLQETVLTNPGALRVLIIEQALHFSEVNLGFPNTIDVCLLKNDAEEFLPNAIEDGLARKEIARSRLESLTRKSLGVWHQHMRGLKALLESDQLLFHVQPIVEANTGVTIAHELLCRPQHTVFSNPAILLDACIRCGLIWDFGRRVRAAAVEIMRTGLIGKLFINLHPVEMSDPNFVVSIPADLKSKMVFEINERASVLQVAEFRENLAFLQSQGLVFAIDDLGAGYASLNAVALLGAEFLKLDIGMVRGVATSPRKRNLIRRIVQFARDESITVVAEGIENEEDARVVAECGCHMSQGYFYGRPAAFLPADGSQSAQAVSFVRPSSTPARAK
jgi:diguanylate cyclase (GGDEF)-like protein